MFLASSVFFAIYDAVSAARKEEGVEGYFRLDSPATAEKIRMSCVDKFTKQASFFFFFVIHNTLWHMHIALKVLSGAAQYFECSTLLTFIRISFFAF